LLEEASSEGRADAWMEHRDVLAMAVDAPDRVKPVGSFEGPDPLSLGRKRLKDLGVEAHDGSRGDRVAR
jgi:hypothetical protein